MSKFNDIELRNKKQGDTIFYRIENKYSSTRLSPIEHTLYVTKVTKDYIYARGSNDVDSNEYRDKYKFHIDNGYEIVDYGESGICYSSKEFFEAEEKAIQRMKCMEDEFSHMHTDSDMRLVNAMYEFMNNWEG